ncbi:MAG: TetR family transcriptional regulator [Conexibacter sp.]
MLRDISASATSPTAAGDTRTRILHATLATIAEGGIAAVSNRRVAAEAGVALGSLTYHFPSQTDLLRDTLLLYVEEEVARLTALAADLRAGAPSAERAAAAVERTIAHNAGRPEEVAELELHLHASRDPALHEASQRCFGAYEDFAAAALEVLGVPDPDRHARTVVALLCGMGVRRLGTGEHHAEGTAEALLTVVRGAQAAAGGM